jgi:hypothetical protein
MANRYCDSAQDSALDSYRSRIVPVFHGRATCTHAETVSERTGMARKPKPPKMEMARSTQGEAEADPLFDAILDAEGHRVPADRRAGLMAAYKDMRKQAAIVRSHPLGAELEPSNTFSLVPYTTQTERKG